MSRSFTVLPQRSSGELPSTINGVALNITGTGNIGNVSGVTIGSSSLLPSMGTQSQLPMYFWGAAQSSNGQYIAAYGNDAYVRLSSNYGVTWTLGQQLGGGPYNQTIAMSPDGAMLIAGTEPYISSNYGVTWTRIGAAVSGMYTGCFSSNGSVIYIGYGQTSSYVSSNSGVSWTALNFGSVGTTNAINQMVCSSNGSIVLVNTQSVAPLISSNYGSTWTVTSGSGLNGADRSTGLAMTPDGATILVINASGYPTISSNTGSTWTTLSNAGNGASGVYMSSNASRVVVGYYGGLIKIATGSPVNASSTWTSVAFVNGWSSFVGSYDGRYLTASIPNTEANIWGSIDSGSTWTLTKAGVQPSNIGFNYGGAATSYDGSVIFTAHTLGQMNLTISSNSGLSWIRAPIFSPFTMSYANLVVYNGFSMSANGVYYGYCDGRNRFYMSSNSGSSFAEVTAISYQALPGVTFSSNGSTILMPKTPSGLLLSTNSGSSWTTIASTLSNWNNIGPAMSSNATYILASSSSNVYISSNSGSTFTAISSIGTSSYGWWLTMSYDGRRMAAAPNGVAGNIWWSSNSGVAWNRSTSSGSNAWQTMSSSGDGMKIVATMSSGANGNVSVSVDGGVTWSSVGNSDGYNIYTACVSGDGSTIYVGKNGTNALTRIPIRPALENPISTVATISNLTSSNVTASGTGSNFTVTGNELILYNGSSNTSNYGAGHDTLTLRSTAEAYAGGVASLAFANSNTGYPLGRVYAVDNGTVPTGSSTSLVFQSTVSNQLVPAMTITGSNVSTSGTISIQQIQKTLNTIANPGSGTVVANWSTGDVWYVTSLTANFTINLTTLPTTENKSYLVDFMLVQGATPYYISALQIAGAAQTIKWSGGSAPTPTANRVERETFTLLYTGSAWTVMGQLTSFG